jgi:hypothetical protein
MYVWCALVVVCSTLRVCYGVREGRRHHQPLSTNILENPHLASSRPPHALAAKACSHAGTDGRLGGLGRACHGGSVGPLRSAVAALLLKPLMDTGPQAHRALSAEHHMRWEKKRGRG